MADVLSPSNDLPTGMDDIPCRGRDDGNGRPRLELFQRGLAGMDQRELPADCASQGQWNRRDYQGQAVPLFSRAEA